MPWRWPEFIQLSCFIPNLLRTGRIRRINPFNQPFSSIKGKSNMSDQRAFNKDVLNLDCEKETARITNKLRELLKQELKRRGFVVAISGGIDSSVTATL